MSCNCQNRYTGNCKQYIKKDSYRDAKRKYPIIDNPMEKWECDEEYAKTCLQFVPYPPKMTDEQFVKEQDEILANVPKEFRGKLSYMAYERGHSSGNEEVIGILKELVSDLKESIENFEKRIREESKKTS